MMRKLLFVMMASFLVACSTNPYQLTNEQLDKVIEGKAIAIIDVREVEEFEEGHIEGSINIPLGVVVDSAKVFAEYNHVVVICKSGNRSGQAIQKLEEKGLTNLVNGGGWAVLNKDIKRRMNENK